MHGKASFLAEDAEHPNPCLKKHHAEVGTANTYVHNFHLRQMSSSRFAFKPDRPQLGNGGSQELPGLKGGKHPRSDPSFVFSIESFVHKHSRTVHFKKGATPVKIIWHESETKISPVIFESIEIPLRPIKRFNSAER